jgi:TolB-like protein/Flp pilus assembly protein TadD
MTENHSFVSATLAELNRRKVLRTVGAYAVAVFVLLQLMDAAVEPLRLPEWLPTLVVIALILAFPLVFLLAWRYQITPQGVQRTMTAGLLSHSQSSFLFSFMLLATAGLGYVFYQYYSGVFETVVEEVVAQREFKAPVNSIAVLPFTDLSEGGDRAYFSDGIAEEILNLLTQVDGLHVAARTSSFAFRDPQKDIGEIGRLLNVRTLLEGSIRSAGTRIRLTAQLINVEDGYHIWSQSYDRELDDVFALQDEIASNIASSLVDSFAGLNTKPAKRTNSLAAANAYRTGRLHWWRRSPEELQRAIELFASALEHDALFAPAYAALADSWMLLSLYGNITPLRATEKAQPMIEKALAIDPGSAEAFAALGLARWQIGQIDAAESALRQSVELNENYVPAQLWLAGVLGDQGRYPEESLVLEQAMILDPLNELLAVNYAKNLSVRGNYDGAREMMHDLIDLRPDSTMLLRSMSSYALGHGDLVEGWRLANRSYELEPQSPAVIEALAKTWLLLGDTEEAERLLEEGLSLAEQNLNLQGTYFMMLVVEGRFEEADALVRDLAAQAGSAIPEKLQNIFNLQRGMIALAREDYASASEFLDAAMTEVSSPSLDGMEFTIVTMAAYADQQIGNDELASERLQLAERAARRARLNGVDNPGIYYTEAIIHALRDEREPALQKLQQAYERGFRELWLFAIDMRMDGLRDDPLFIALQQQIEDDVNQARAEIRSQLVASL